MNTAIQSLTISSRRKRITAFMLDHCLITFLMVAVILLANGTDFIDEDNSELSSTMLMVMLPGFLLYIAKDSIKGVSFGKWMMGVMVRDAVNPSQIPSFVRLFARNLFLIIWPVELIVLASSQERRRLGDKSVKSIVVENHTKTSKLPRTLAVVGIVIIVFAFMFLFAGSAIKNSDAYKIAINEIEKNEEILKETGGIKGYGVMPTGSINLSNESGEAQLVINVIGNTTDVKVKVHLTKDFQGKWRLMEMTK